MYSLIKGFWRLWVNEASKHLTRENLAFLVTVVCGDWKHFRDALA